MEEHQIRQLVMLVMTIPVMQFESLLTLDHLSADGAEPVLLFQDVCATWRRRLQCQLSVTMLEVRLPGGIKWVGVALHLDMTLRCNSFPHANHLLPADRIGEPPGFPRLMREVPLGDPTSGFGRVAPFGPPIESSPDEIVEFGERLATDDVTVIVRPTPQDGVEGIDELCRGTACASFTDTESFDLRFEGLEARLARRDLQLGRFAMGPLMFAEGLP